jgi:23S rRNA pseudouridine2605 synthase
MQERIQKVLANAGVASRRHVEEMILQGRVSVNGRPVTRLPVMIDPQKDRVEVDGELIKLKTPEAEKKYYILLNKPKGVYATNVAQGVQTRAIDLLPQGFKARVYPVGRLDADAKGLLLLTNDGELTNQLTHPRYGVVKAYRAVVDGYVKDDLATQAEKGIWLADPHSGKGFKTGRARLKVVKRINGKSILEISLREGRNSEVRRMLAKLGHKVRDLTRVRFGPIYLDNLKPGESRALTPREVKDLKASARPSTYTDAARSA